MTVGGGNKLVGIGIAIAAAVEQRRRSNCGVVVIWI
jgi:hypothetical protein